MGTSAMLATNKRPAQLSAANWEIMLWNWGAAQARVAAPDLGQNPRQNLWSTEQRSRRGRRIYTKYAIFEFLLHSPDWSLDDEETNPLSTNTKLSLDGLEKQKQKIWREHKPHPFQTLIGPALLNSKRPPDQ